MGKQLSEVDNLYIYLMDFSNHSFSSLFIHILGPAWGPVFWPLDLKFCTQVRLIYILGYALNFFHRASYIACQSWGAICNELPGDLVLRGLKVDEVYEDNGHS